MTDNAHVLQSKLYYLFGPTYSEWDYSNTDYLSYVTPKIIIDKIIELAKEYYQGLNDKVIWDMFAGAGCDAIRLARHSGKVICTEIDSDTYRCLEQNIKTRDQPNIEIYNKDCCDMINTQCNIIYFDPPWGDTFRSGKDFDFNDVILNNGMTVLKLAKDLSTQHHLIIKSPISSDSFEQVFGDRVVAIFTFTQQKLKYLFVKAINAVEY